MEKTVRPSKSHLKLVQPPIASSRPTSRMMSLLIVDVLTARKVDMKAGPTKKPAKKAQRA